jgi:cell division protease FtsH
MVSNWGLSKAFGPLKDYKQASPEISTIRDKEIKRILTEGYAKAQKIINANMDKLHIMTEALMKYETIGEKQLKDIMDGKTEISEPDGWNAK